MEDAAIYSINKKNGKCVILARVSTDEQDYSRQVDDLTVYAKKEGLSVVKIFTSKISGATPNSLRPEINSLKEYISKNAIQVVLVTEISRLGRDTKQALDIIDFLTQHKVSLHILNLQLDTLKDNGEINPMATFLCTILLEVARMERVTIRQRMKSGYERYLAQGGRIGAKPGKKLTDEKLLKKYPKAVSVIKKGYTLRECAKLSGVSVNTIRKIKKIL